VPQLVWGTRNGKKDQKRNFVEPVRGEKPKKKRKKKPPYTLNGKKRTGGEGAALTGWEGG